MLKLKSTTSFNNKLIKGKFEHENHISFSYVLLTDDKDYTFSKFGKSNIREHLIVRQELDELLFEISKCTWAELQDRSKMQLGGFESMKLTDLKPQVYKRAKLTRDVSTIVFRFGGNKYRLIGYKYPKSNVLYVLGFDLDFSAYNHG